jgi:hypothetical protein
MAEGDYDITAPWIPEKSGIPTAEAIGIIRAAFSAGGNHCAAAGCCPQWM